MEPIQIAQPSLGEEEFELLRESLMSGWITQGPKVAEFEKAFAERHHVEHAIATTSCTTALHLILLALGVGPGDEVIVPSFTWIATANVVLYCGATPVFADVDPTTYNIDVTDVVKKVTDRTRAIIPVHLFGLCAEMDDLRAAVPDIPLIEDAACAAGASYKGRAAGSLGVAGAFSFHPRKPMTTGEGGMITTNDAELADRVRVMRNHGASVSEEARHHGARPYLLPDFSVLGFNYRMTDLQGAIGQIQLKKLDSFISERQKWSAFYEANLEGVPWLSTPHFPKHCTHSWQAYVCRVDEAKAPKSRNDIMQELQEMGVSTRPGTHAVHVQKLYSEKYDLRADSCPVAYGCQEATIAIPLHNLMTQRDYAYVVECIQQLAQPGLSAPSLTN